MFIEVGNGPVKPSSNPDEAVCITYRANTYLKGMHLTILPAVIG